MKKGNSIRDYRFSDATLKQECDSKAKSITRDILKFNARGVTAATVTAFSTLSTNFGNLPTDEELKADVSQATLDKDTAAENQKIAIRSIRTMAANKYGEGSPKYKKFGFKDMGTLNDNDLHRLGKRVVRVAPGSLSDLNLEGLNAALIASLNGLVTIFDNAIDAKDDAVNNRDIKTQERIDSGNVLYKELVRLCNIGKDLFASTDAARYNDYIIYDEPKVNPVVPPANPPSNTTDTTNPVV